MYTIEIKEFTVAEVIKAIAENGFDHLRGRWFQRSYGEGSLTGGCVLMQGGLNLGVAANNSDIPSPFELAGDDGKVVIPEGLYNRYGNHILHPSEVYDEYNLAAQLNNLEVSPDNKYYDGGHAGDTIVNWNDKTDINGNYVLRTYKDVEKMVRSVLNPHRHKKIKLAVVDYSSWNIVKVPVNA